MKKLIVVRHAKSSWGFNVIDHERPLNERGLDNAEKVSKYLKNEKLNIDMILSSDAIRTKTTANIFISNLEISKEILHLNHDLYDFSGENLVKTIKSTDDKIDCLMLFGHNHAITSFVNSFGDDYIDSVPTCGVVVIEFNSNSWKELNKGKTVKTVFPRDFK